MEKILQYLQENGMQIASTLALIIAIAKGKYQSDYQLRKKAEAKLQKIENKKLKMRSKYENLLNEAKEVKEDLK